MNNWLIIPKEETFNITTYKLSVTVGNHKFYTNTDKLSYYFDENKREGCFIYGYLLPRLNKDVKSEPVTLLDQFKTKGEKFLEDYKGIFTLIFITRDKISVFNDRVGISKFFYNQDQNDIYASNDILPLKQFVSLGLSMVNIYIYLLFNYFIEDRTAFREIFHSPGGTMLNIGLQSDISKWFDFKQFLDHREIKFSKKETFKTAPEFWKQLIAQYLDHFKDHNISQTLTAGLDSRMILAGIRNNNYNPDTFTFGNEHSMDVHYAKKVAKELGLNHHHFYPESTFFDNYHKKSAEVVGSGNGLVTLFRSHRLDAYKKLSNHSDVILFGFIGSEIIRSLYPDGLTLSRIISDYWVTGIMDPVENLKELGFLNIDDSIVKNLKNEITNLRFLDFPDLYLFDVMIPMHFGQDIRLLERIDIASIAPFWDIDFLEFQKSTPFFITNDRKKDFATLGHFQRRKGPYYSSKIITSLDPKSARISLGKGYSPKDFSTSFYLSGIKFLIYKKRFGDKFKVQNFGYFNWFKKYLQDYYSSHDMSYLGIDSEKVLQSINSNNGTDEFGNMQFVKFINIDILRNLMS